MTHRRRQRTHARSGDGTHLRTHAYDKTARPRFHAVPPIIPSGLMAVTRNAVRRGGPTAQISGAEPLICQPTAILSAAPQARGGRPVWRNQSPVTGDTKLACGAPKWHVGGAVLNTWGSLSSDNGLQRHDKEQKTDLPGREVCCQQWSGEQEKGHGAGTGRQWVMQHRGHESRVPVFDPAKLSNEKWAHTGETAFGGHNEVEKENIDAYVILSARVFRLLQLLSCQMVLSFRETWEKVIFEKEK